MERAQILVVEDESIVAKDLELRLTEMGYTVPGVVSSGEDAVEKAAETCPDLVLMDIRLNGKMDGVEAAARIRAQRDIPVIYLTAYADKPTVERAKVTGPFGYVLKPFEERELQVAIEMALYKHQMERKLREREQWLATILAGVADAVLVTDLHGQVAFMNRAAEALTGWRTDEALGRSIGEVCCLIDETTQRATENPVLNALRRGESVGFTNDVVLLAKDGTTTFIADSTAPIRDDRGNITGAVLTLQNLTERKQVQKALQAEAQVSTALARMGQELIAALDSSTLLNRLCQLTAEVLACDCSYTVLWQPQEKAYMPVAGWGGSPEQQTAMPALKISRAEMGTLLTQLAEVGMWQTTVAASTDCSLLAVVQQYGITDVIFLALRRGDDVIGIQTACYKRSALLTPQRQWLARGIAHLASLVLENARLLELAENANQLKSDFLATMSHEMRTPLHIIMGYTDLLLEGDYGPLAAEQVDSLQRISQSTRELYDLITAMLDVRRLEVGLLPMEVSEVHVAELIEGIRREMTAMREKEHLSFVWQIAPDLPRLYTDRNKLEVILKSLLSNAVKFTDAGEVVVAVSPQRDGVDFSVSDTGVGIAREVLPVIFEPFRQGDGTTTRRHEGIGLGLYMVRRLLELLKGAIAVRSEVGQGSTFRVWIPWEVKQEGAVAATVWQEAEEWPRSVREDERGVSAWTTPRF